MVVGVGDFFAGLLGGSVETGMLVGRVQFGEWVLGVEIVCFD